MHTDHAHRTAPAPRIDWQRVRLTSLPSSTLRMLRVVLIVVAYTALAIILTWPLARTLDAGITSSIDPVDNIWRIAWAQHQLLHDPRHLFTANTFYPFPDSYLFDGCLLGAAILGLPLAIVGVAPLAIYNLTLILSLALSGIAMYALARRFGAMPLAAFVAGAIYAYAPMHLDRVGHIAFLSAQWFPLVLLFLDRLIEKPRPRDALALAASLVMAALSSQYYAIYLAFLVPLFLLVMVLRRPETRRWIVWAYLAGAGGAALLVVVPVALAFRQVQVKYGLERTYGQVTYYAATLSDFFTTESRNLFWGKLTAPLRSNGTFTFERVMFPGLIALVLAGIGLWVGRRRAWEQFLAALILVAGLLALGPELRLTPDDNRAPLFHHLPYDVFFWHLPGFDSMRVPARFGTLFLLGIAGLAATGCTALCRGIAARPFSRPAFARVLPIIAGVAILCGLGVEYASTPLPLKTLESGAAIPPVYHWLASEPNARVLELPLVLPDHEDTEFIAVREEYYSLVHGHPEVNGYANVIPKGFKALVLDMKRFPSPRTVAIIQGLGVTDVVIHFDQYNDADRTQLEAQLRADIPGLTAAAQFPDTALYRVAPSAPLAQLRATLPLDKSIYLSREDPLGTGAYMGMLGYVLHANPLYARLTVEFGTGYRGAPQPGQRYEYAILYPQEDPAAVGFAGAPLIWQDSVVRVYQQRAAP